MRCIREALPGSQTIPLCKFEPEIFIKHFRKTLKGFQRGITFAWFFKPLVCLIRYAENFSDISLGKFSGFPELPEKYRDGNFRFRFDRIDILPFYRRRFRNFEIPLKH